jgi:hypothetical protein
VPVFRPHDALQIRFLVLACLLVPAPVTVALAQQGTDTVVVTAEDPVEDDATAEATRLVAEALAAAEAAAAAQAAAIAEAEAEA